MLPDFVQDTIEDSIHYYCKNCLGNWVQPYSNRGFICVGIVKKSKRKPKYDTIKFCMGNYENPDDIYSNEMTPDESLSLCSLLTHANSEWLLLSKEYRNFRNVNER